MSTAIGERTLWRASANCSPVLFLLSVENEGFHVMTSRYISRTVTAWWGWNLSQKLSDGAATERSGACDVARSMSAVSGAVKSLCGAGVAIAVLLALVTSEQLLQLKFSVHSSLWLGHYILRENIYNTYDTRRLPYVGDPCRVDNGFDQPSGYGLGVGRAALRVTRLS